MSAIPSYVTRERLKRALENAGTPADDELIDAAIAHGSRQVDDLCNRVFYPTVDTRYFDWPNGGSPTPWRLWLDEDELLAVSSIAVGEDPVDPTPTPTPDEDPYYTSDEDVATGVAGASISGHHVVAWDDGGLLVHASSSDASFAGSVVGVSSGAVSLGGDVTAVTRGLMTESSWSWTPDGIVWCGVDGVLTQTAPTSGFVQRVGWATTSTSIYVTLGEPTVLA